MCMCNAYMFIYIAHLRCDGARGNGLILHAFAACRDTRHACEKNEFLMVSSFRAIFQTCTPLKIRVGFFCLQFCHAHSLKSHSRTRRKLRILRLLFAVCQQLCKCVSPSPSANIPTICSLTSSAPDRSKFGGLDRDNECFCVMCTDLCQQTKRHADIGIQAGRQGGASSLYWLCASS